MSILQSPRIMTPWPTYYHRVIGVISPGDQHRQGSRNINANPIANPNLRNSWKQDSQPADLYSIPSS